MSLVPYALTRRLLFKLDPERAHDLTIGGLERLQDSPARCLWQQPRVDDALTLFGLRFPNRVGLAAGMDKNGSCIDGLGGMGFGHLEIGTVTPRPQPGNPQPRLFRLPAAEALINRMGFNNLGLSAFLAHVQRSRRFRAEGGILGLNIGKNASTPIEHAADDYLNCLEGVYPHADYVVVNVSSPNTRNLRTLQDDKALDTLLGQLMQRRQTLATQHGRTVPLLVKIAPDLEPEQVEAIALTLQRQGLDGVVATNTTVARVGVDGLPHANESGGLSGAPLRQTSNAVIRRLRLALGPTFPIIGVGGVLSAADALAKRAAGADLVQIYTGLVYRGPGLVPELAQALRRG